METKVLYISYDGILEPLGFSQVFGYLKILSESCSITLISFEKPQDLMDIEKVSKIEKEMVRFQIDWIRKTYHNSPTLLATLWDVLTGFCSSLRIITFTRIDLIHLRGYVPMLMALLIGKFSSKKLLFDMRGFWPDEKVDRGAWTKKSLIYKTFKYLEKVFLFNADFIVTLTKASKEYLLNEDLVKFKEKIYVIPTCVDLLSFKVQKEFKNTLPEVINFVHLGSVDTAYDINPVFQLFQSFNTRFTSKLHFINRDKKEYIERKAKEYNLIEQEYEVVSCTQEEVSNLLSTMHLGVFYLNENFSIQASFPTKIAEFLATGTPFICNNFNKDIKEFCSDNEVGILLNSSNFEITIDEAIKVLKQPISPKRCREISKTMFDVNEGAKVYKRIYNLVSMDEGMR